METPEHDDLEAALRELATAPEPSPEEITGLIDAVEAELDRQPRLRWAWWLVAAAALCLAGLVLQKPPSRPIPAAAVDALVQPMPGFAVFGNSAERPAPEPPPTLANYRNAEDLDELLWRHGRHLLPKTPES